MANVASGVTNTSNTAIGQGEPWGLPLGSVLSRDGQVIREMKATVALNVGDAVILDPATGVYNVTKSAVEGSQARYGVAVTAATAASLSAWICIEGVCDMIAGSAVSVGDILETSAASAGQVQAARDGAAGSGDTNVITFTATLSPAGVSTWAQQLFAASFWTNSQYTLASTDRVISVNKPTIQAGLAIGGAIISADASAVGINFMSITSASVTPTASEVYKLFVARAETQYGVAGAIIGQAQTSASAAGVRFRGFVNPA